MARSCPPAGSREGGGVGVGGCGTRDFLFNLKTKIEKRKFGFIKEKFLEREGWGCGSKFWSANSPTCI